MNYLLDGEYNDFYEEYLYPILTKETFYLSFWPLIIIFILFVCLIWEVNEYDPNQFKKTKDIQEIIDKLRLNHNIVTWRRSLIVSLIAGFLIVYFLFTDHKVKFFDYLMISLIIFISVYLVDAWFLSHWWKMVDYKIEDFLYDYRNHRN